MTASAKSSLFWPVGRTSSLGESYTTPWHCGLENTSGLIKELAISPSGHLQVVFVGQVIQGWAGHAQ